ncbi:hypothetical protein ORI60_35620 [Lentzea sp. NEAU-D7]|nr:hypothetical protein [Lentzea sp. NEAU-D7]
MRLARRCTAALHEAYGVISPDELTYRAWRELAGAPAVAVEFPALGLA